MNIDREDVPVVGTLLATYLTQSTGAFATSRDVEVTNGVMLHASAALFASALAAIMRANPPELSHELLETWMRRIRERVETELRDHDAYSSHG